MRLREIPMDTALFACGSCSLPLRNLADGGYANTRGRCAEEGGERARESTEI
jgi:hypothetical protein